MDSSRIFLNATCSRNILGGYKRSPDLLSFPVLMEQSFTEKTTENRGELRYYYHQQMPGCNSVCEAGEAGNARSE